MPEEGSDATRARAAPLAEPQPHSASTCYSAIAFLTFLPRWTAASRKSFPDWRLYVTRTPGATHLPRVRLHKSRHACKTDHEGHGVAMCGLRRDVQGETVSGEHASEFRPCWSSAESRLNAHALTLTRRARRTSSA